MTANLTDFDKELLNLLQAGLEPIGKPFALIAQQLTSNEATVLGAASRLSEAGYIKRISATIDHSRLGKTSALVTAHVAQELVEDVGSAVSGLEGVSHNYIRDHYFNLWFTLQGASLDEMNHTIDPIAKRYGIEFHILPAITTFKLDVRFDAKSSGRSLLASRANPVLTETGEPVKLSPQQVATIRKLQQPLAIISEPFDDIWQIAGLITSGVIKRIGAVVDYRKLGFAANAMFVCEVKESDIHRIGQALAKLENVSHCYQRPAFENWPYNLFAMLHGPDMQSLGETVSTFTKEHAIVSFALLQTIKELKKTPVRV